MAKSKKNKSTANNGTKPMSDKRYFLERVSALPLDKCYMTPEWKESNMGIAIVTRRMSNGNIAFASFLIDTGCLGVKHVMYTFNQTDDYLKEYMERLNTPFEETDYATVHNFILGALEYAENLGINPDPDYSVAENILQEDNDDIELISFEFGGTDGKPVLVIGPDGNEKKYIGHLSKLIGDGQFSVIWYDGEHLVDDEGYFKETEKWILDGEYQSDSTLDEDDIRYYDAVADLLRLNAITLRGLEDSEEDEEIPVTATLLDPCAPGHERLVKITADRSFLWDEDLTDSEKLDIWILTRDLGLEPIEEEILSEALLNLNKMINDTPDDSVIR